jgi:hypothetical protein
MDWGHIDLIRERRRRGGGGRSSREEEAKGDWGQPSQQPNKYINKYMKYVQKTINPFTPPQYRDRREEKAASSSTHQSAPMDWMEGRIAGGKNKAEQQIAQINNNKKICNKSESMIKSPGNFFVHRGGEMKEKRFWY